MNAYLNQVIQQFQYGRLGKFNPGPSESEQMSRKVREWFRESVDCTPYLVHPHEYWDRLIEISNPDEEIRHLHEEYDTVLRECVYCDRLIEVGPDWGDYCEECYWALSDEGRD